MVDAAGTASTAADTVCQKRGDAVDHIDDDDKEDLLLSPQHFPVRAGRVVLSSYFESNSGRLLVKHQTDSYNDFIIRRMAQIIEGANPIEVNHQWLPESGRYKYMLTVCVESPTLGHPMMTEPNGSTKVMLPQDARLRNLTYAAPLSVDVSVTARSYVPETGETKTETRRIPNVCIGRIPVMVRSQFCMLSQQQSPSPTDECRFDCGGYFIVNGNENAVISLDRLAENRPYVFHTTKASSNNNYAFSAETRSVPEARFGVPKTTALRLAARSNQHGHCIRVVVQHIMQETPLFVMFRALGVISDLDIVRHIVGGEAAEHTHTAAKGLPPLSEALARQLVASADEASTVRTQAEALEYMGRYLQLHGQPRELSATPVHRLNVLRSVLRREFLPHVGQDPRKKALYLGHMARSLLMCSLGLWRVDDRDSYTNKRLDTPGVLLANLFRQSYAKVVKDMRNQLRKDINAGAWKATNNFVSVVSRANIDKILRPTVIKCALKYGLATGNWGAKTARLRQGVAQLLNRMSKLATLSHLRRINTSIEKTGKLVQPRKLHATQWGIICPSETPEGASVGLVKNLALTADITVASPSAPLRAALRSGAIPPGMLEYVPSDDAPAGAVASAGATTSTTTTTTTTTTKTTTTTTAYSNGSSWGGMWSYGASPLPADPSSSCADAAVQATWVVPSTSGTRVFVNGDLVGEHSNPAALVASLRLMKRRSLISAFTSIAWSVERNEIVMCTEGGRFVRPLLIVDPVAPGRSRLRLTASIVERLRQGTATWKDLVLGTASSATERAPRDYADADSVVGDADDADRGSLIEYLDVNESNHAMIAMSADDLVANPTVGYTHIEIDPAIMLGVVAGSIPFAHHNQAPRNTYQSAMGKQAMGVPASNVWHRYDMTTHILDYAQKPLVTTATGVVVNCNELPSGINAIVAIMCYTGYNPEDSVIVNNASVDRGFFSSTYLRTYREQCGKNHSTGEEEFFTRPDPGATQNMRPLNYGNLAADGFVPESTAVVTGDVIVGKVMPQKVDQTVHHRDASLALRGHGTEVSYVDRNCANDRHFTNVTGDGYRFAKVRLRAIRTPTIGDKFSCLLWDHDILTSTGWKGVADVTVDDLVATLQPPPDGTHGRPGRLVYVAPLEVICHPDYDGDLYHVANLAVDLSVTTNHRMYVAQRSAGTDGKFEYQPPRLVRADELVGRRARYQRGAEWDAPDYQVVLPAHGDTGERAPDMDAWLVFLGLWYAEGRAHNDETDAYTVGVCAVLASAMPLLGHTYRTPEDNHYTVSDKQLHSYLSPLATRQQLPSWVWELSTRQARVLLQAMLLSDGHWGLAGSAGYSTSSAALTDDVMRLCLHCGWAGTIMPDHPAGHSTTVLSGLTTTKESGSWRVGVSKTDDEAEVNHEHPEVQVEEVVPFKGPVYCLRVPSEIFYVRRNGKGCWTGNSRHGQKGTVGITYPAEDMPFTSDGMQPDLIINPHAVPSRMTVGQLLECVLGKACAAAGSTGDASSFVPSGTSDSICDALAAHGYERHGDQVMHDPRTGAQMEMKVFIGPTYYQRLKHMVCEKVHCLSGDHDVLTVAGWKSIATVTVNDRVATLRPYGAHEDGVVSSSGRPGRREYVHPMQVMRYDGHKGDMYHVATGDVDFNVTMEHRMYVSWPSSSSSKPALVRACDVMGKPDVRYHKCADWDVPDGRVPAGHLLTSTESADAWLNYIGLRFYEDARYDVSETEDDQGVQTSSERLLRWIVKQNGGGGDDDDDNDGSKRGGLHLGLLVSVEPFFLAHSPPFPDRRLPYWTWDLSARHVAACYDVMRLCLHAGWSGQKVWTWTSRRDDRWRVIVRADEDMYNGSRVRGVKVKVEEEDEAEDKEDKELDADVEEVVIMSDREGVPVFCLSVPNQIFYVRRNGKAAWTGNSRSTNGPVVMLTRQPAEGRARDGGLRLGEMEIECNWAHGTMHFLKERFQECSDNYRIFTCRLCGMIADVNPERNLYRCVPCRNRTLFAELRVPYAAKLMIQEIATMAIATRFHAT